MPSGNFQVVLDPQARKELEKLWRSDRRLATLVVRALDALPEDPFTGKPLAGVHKGVYSLRQGDYRILYEVYRQAHAIHIIQIGHRKEVYR